MSGEGLAPSRVSSQAPRTCASAKFRHPDKDKLMRPEDISKLITEDIHNNNGLLSEFKDKIPQRTLGKTKLKVSILAMGGQGSAEKQEHDESIKIFQRAYKLGINYFDTAPIYGPSEDYVGEAIEKFRKKITLATKTDDRTRDGSLRLIEKSLKRLRTDYIDIWQLHHLDTMKDVNEITKKGGALEALTEMRDQDVVRFLGFTGHENPTVLEEMASRFEFDTTLCAVNAADVHVKPSFVDSFLPVAKKLNLGVIGMKVFSQGYIFNPDGLTTTWEPLHYAMSLPLSTVIVGHDTVAQLEENAAIARSFIQLSPKELREIEEKTKSYPKRACFFRSKYGGYDSKKKLDPPYQF